MKKLIITVAVLIALFFGVGGILPALAKVRDMGAMPGAFVGSYTLGVFLLSALCSTTMLYAISRRKA